MRTTIQAGQGRVERRQRAVAEIQILLADVYRGFIAWASLYGDGHYEQEHRERVPALIDRLSNGYLARSMWLEPGARKKVEDFIEKSEDLYSRFCADIEERGYTKKVKKSMANRVSRQLRSARKVAESNLQDDPDDSRPRWPARLRLSARSG